MTDSIFLIILFQLFSTASKHCHQLLLNLLLKSCSIIVIQDLSLIIVIALLVNKKMPSSVLFAGDLVTTAAIALMFHHKTNLLKVLPQIILFTTAECLCKCLRKCCAELCKPSEN